MRYRGLEYHGMFIGAFSDREPHVVMVQLGLPFVYIPEAQKHWREPCCGIFSIAHHPGVDSGITVDARAIAAMVFLLEGTKPSSVGYNYIPYMSTFSCLSTSHKDAIGEM
jgi:hypothetical protein